MDQAKTGQQALDLVAAERPDVVLLDLNLPDMHDAEVCRRIKATSDVPVLLTSAVAIPTEFETVGDGCIVGVEPDDLVGPVRAMSLRPPPPAPA